VRFCHEPLAREIGQPFPTFTTQNKFTLPYLYRRRGKIQPVANAGKSNQWQARENNVTEVMTVSFFLYHAGTEEHQKVWELLSKAWSVIEPNLEGFAIQIFRLMFKRDSGLFPLFPFFKDEWSRVAYTDYNGTYPEQPPQSWFVVFR